MPIELYRNPMKSISHGWPSALSGLRTDSNTILLFLETGFKIVLYSVGFIKRALFSFSMDDYKKLLTTAREELPEHVFEKERFEIPKVRGHIQGSRTVVSNFLQIANELHREPEHILKFVLRDLATPGEIKKSGSVIFGSKVPASRINDSIRRYATAYVFCPDTGKPDTVLEKEGNLTYLRSLVTGTRKLVKPL